MEQRMRDLLAALEQQLKQLTQQAKAIDAKQSSWQQKAWFDSDLFQSHSPFLTDYVLEAEAMLKRLKLSSEQKTSSAQALAAKLGAQIQALSRAFQTKDLRYLPGKGKKRPASPNASEQAQAMVGQLRRSTQELYQQLSEYQGYERRLLDMLELEQRQLSGGSADTNADRVLAIHARLGRCRKALSELEVEIQWSEQNRRG
jgi:primosomal replication protein N''